MDCIAVLARSYNDHSGFAVRCYSGCSLACLTLFVTDNLGEFFVIFYSTRWVALQCPCVVGPLYLHNGIAIAGFSYCCGFTVATRWKHEGHPLSIRIGEIFEQFCGQFSRINLVLKFGNLKDYSGDWNQLRCDWGGLPAHMGDSEGAGCSSVSRILDSHGGHWQECVGHGTRKSFSCKLLSPYCAW